MATTLERGIQDNLCLCSQTVVTHSWFKNKLSHSLCHKSYILGGQRKYLSSCCFSQQLIELSSFFSRTPAIYKPEFIFRHKVRFKEREGKDKEQDTYTVSAGQGPVLLITASTPTRWSAKVLIA